MVPDDAQVILIDDDDSFRRSTERLLRAAGYEVLSFSSSKAFLASRLPNIPCCVVLDIRMPGLSGLDLQRELIGAGINLPLIFITGHGDVPTSVQAMKAGALEFLTKPFRDRDLLDAVEQALERAQRTRQVQDKRKVVEDLYASLTPREKQVMAGVVSGRLNKQIAAELGTTEKTIKFHRSHVMQKMQATSLADLVRKADRLNLPTA